MKTLLLLLTALPARADLSDSGNLSIGGQAVIAGSTTVQGAAFSVGGSTFIVGGGSVTLGGRLNTAVAGIRWADGTTSTTAAPGGSGALGSDNTWSGTNAYQSSVTFNGLVAFNVSAATDTYIPGGTILHSGSWGVAVATLTFTASPGGCYDFDANIYFANGASVTSVYANVLIDSAYTPEFGANEIAAHHASTLDGGFRPLPVHYTMRSLSGGQHTVALLLRSTAANSNIYNDTARSQMRVRNCR